VAEENQRRPNLKAECEETWRLEERNSGCKKKNEEGRANMKQQTSKPATRKRRKYRGENRGVRATGVWRKKAALSKQKEGMRRANLIQ